MKYNCFSASDHCCVKKPNTEHGVQDEKLSALLWTTFQGLTSEIPRIVF